MSWFTIRVSASSANLGPGFDSLGVALGVYLTCRFRPSGALAIRVEGRDAAGIPAGPDDLIWQTAVTVARSHGAEIPPIELHIHNDIPLGKGMGSSAAALTTGVIIADRLLGLQWKPLRILDEAARFEGHPDNVAPCALGSIVASAIDSSGVTRAARAPRSSCSSSAVTRASATWCARSSACTATNRRPCSPASPSTGLK